MLKDFKDFIMRGNVLDLAVGVIIATAFMEIVTGITEGILNPIIGRLVAGIDLKGLAVTIGGVEMQYGLFLDATVKFVITAFALFLIVRLISKLLVKPPVEEAPATKTCPYCKSDDVDITATKCPHCTSNLEN